MGLNKDYKKAHFRSDHYILLKTVKLFTKKLQLWVLQLWIETQLCEN